MKGGVVTNVTQHKTLQIRSNPFYKSIHLTITNFWFSFSHDAFDTSMEMVWWFGHLFKAELFKNCRDTEL